MPKSLGSTFITAEYGAVLWNQHYLRDDAPRTRIFQKGFGASPNAIADFAGDACYFTVGPSSILGFVGKSLEGMPLCWATVSQGNFFTISRENGITATGPTIDWDVELHDMSVVGEYASGLLYPDKRGFYFIMRLADWKIRLVPDPRTYYGIREYGVSGGYATVDDQYFYYTFVKRNGNENGRLYRIYRHPLKDFDLIGEPYPLPLSR